MVVSHKHSLMLGARTFPGNLYDGHFLNAALEQATNLMQDHAVTLKQIFVDLGLRGVDTDNPNVEIIHRGKYKSLTLQQKRWLRRRQAVEPAIAQLKSDNRMGRCWLQGALDDARHAISCAAGYNLRCLLRAIARLGLGVTLSAPGAGSTATSAKPIGPAGSLRSLDDLHLIAGDLNARQTCRAVTAAQRTRPSAIWILQGRLIQVASQG